MPGRGAASLALAAPKIHTSDIEGLGRERVTEIQRARMLAGMGASCVELGGPNVTVAHVVARSGVSRRTFYEVFEDREDCFLAAFDDALSRALHGISDTYDVRAKWVDRVRTSLTALLEFLEREPVLGRLLIVESVGVGAKVVRRRAWVLAQVTAVIDEGRRETRAGAELSPLTAEGVVGGVLAVLHSRLSSDGSGSLLELRSQLMGMIVLAYLGPAASRRELERPVPRGTASPHDPVGNPLNQLEMRLTYRTVRVLMAIADHPGSSNRRVAQAADVSDQGQMSKLLARLVSLGLIQNTGGGQTRGEPNSWTLTERGWEIQSAVAHQPDRS